MWSLIDKLRGLTAKGILANVKSEFEPQETVGPEPRPVPVRWDPERLQDEWTSKIGQLEKLLTEVEALHRGYFDEISPRLRGEILWRKDLRLRALKLRLVNLRVQNLANRISGSSQYQYLRLTEDESFAVELRKLEDTGALQPPLSRLARKVVKKAARNRAARNQRAHKLRKWWR